MKTFELHNKITSTRSQMLIFAFFVLPKSYQLYTEFPNSPEARMPFQVVLLLFFGLSVLFLLIFNYLLSKKIRVDDSLVYFMKKNYGGFGNWIIEKVINFSEVALVRSREKKVFTGKVYITHYWLLFEMKNGSLEELLTNNWDFEELKKLFHHLKNTFPDVTFNTFLLKDSPEKISGLDKLLKQKK